MHATQHRCMSLKVDVSWTKLIYVIFEFVLLRITIIYLTKHRYIHVRNFVRKKPHILHTTQDIKVSNKSTLFENIPAPLLHTLAEAIGSATSCLFSVETGNM